MPYKIGTFEISGAILGMLLGIPIGIWTARGLSSPLLLIVIFVVLDCALMFAIGLVMSMLIHDAIAEETVVINKSTNRNEEGDNAL